MKWNNFVKNLAIAALTVGTLVSPLTASENEKKTGGFYTVPKSLKVHTWVKESIPTTLNDAEFQSLNPTTEVSIRRDVPQRSITREVHFKAFGPTSDGSSLSSHHRSKYRFLSNRYYSNTEAATLVKVEPITGEDSSKFFAIYQLVCNPTIQFSLEGQVPALDRTIVRITDLEEEAKEESSLSLDLLRSPLYSQLVSPLDDLQLLLQQSPVFTNMSALDLQTHLPDGSSELNNALMHAGKHIFSFVAKPLVKKLPGMNVLHPEVELFAKTLGYSTVTHMMTDVMQTGKLNSKLLESDQGTAIVPSELKSQRLHATSRSLGYAISYIPGGSAVRTIMTMHLNRQGFATITHWAMGIKDLDPSEMADLYTPERLGQEGVALAVETLVPFGNVIVAVSQTGARLFLDEPSLTAYAIKKIKKQAK